MTPAARKAGIISRSAPHFLSATFLYQTYALVGVNNCGRSSSVNWTTENIRSTFSDIIRNEPFETATEDEADKVKTLGY